MRLALLGFVQGAYLAFSAGGNPLPPVSSKLQSAIGQLQPPPNGGYKAPTDIRRSPRTRDRAGGNEGNGGNGGNDAELRKQRAAYGLDDRAYRYQGGAYKTYPQDDLGMGRLSLKEVHAATPRTIVREAERPQYGRPNAPPLSTSAHQYYTHGLDQRYYDRQRRRDH
ncbi:hypothetical protein B0I35DRAFT_424368 [Stachybotrys elegans]|uniref:Uncharacterized protein n=1 Tax=Stachybotrys elegans TaxID=80388 RepID=A0A8K0SVK9_9HYPO|nr:hypothetical protein B0I35DRAFT_424368 [Stachybotrys elegans]